jgi:hypothetical protein
MNTFQNNKMNVKVYKDNWYDFFFVKIEQEKSRLFMKSHELNKFTLGSRILNQIVGSRWNFAWSLLICFSTLVKYLIPIGVW